MKEYLIAMWMWHLDAGQMINECGTEFRQTDLQRMAFCFGNYDPQRRWFRVVNNKLCECVTKKEWKYKE